MKLAFFQHLSTTSKLFNRMVAGFFILATSATSSLMAVDVTDAYFSWGKDFIQLSDAPPPNINGDAHFFDARIFIPPASGSAITVELLPPGLPPVPFSDNGGGVWSFEADFPGPNGEADLLTAFPDGNTGLYLLMIDQGLPSQASAFFDPGSVRWPQPPALAGTDFTDLQGLDPAPPFTFDWLLPQPLPPTITAVSLFIEDISTEIEVFGSGPHFNSPFPTSDTMTGGTLAFGTGYSGFIELATGIPAVFQPDTGNTSGWTFGGPGAPSFSVSTLFQFTTATGPSPETVPTLTEWGIISLISGLAIMAFFTVRRLNPIPPIG